MKVHVHGHGIVVGRDMQSMVERRTGEVLHGFGRRLAAVTVRLEQILCQAQAPVRCHVLVDLLPSGGFAVGEIGASTASALEPALARVATLLRRRERGGIGAGRSRGPSYSQAG